MTCGLSRGAEPSVCVVPQGGIGPAGLASEDLHVLDFTDLDKPRWHRCGWVQRTACGRCQLGHNTASLHAP